VFWVVPQIKQSALESNTNDPCIYLGTWKMPHGQGTLNAAYAAITAISLNAARQETQMRLFAALIQNPYKLTDRDLRSSADFSEAKS